MIHPVSALARPSAGRGENEKVLNILDTTTLEITCEHKLCSVQIMPIEKDRFSFKGAHLRFHFYLP